MGDENVDVDRQRVHSVVKPQPGLGWAYLPERQAGEAGRTRLLRATVQRIARSGLLPSRGQMQDVSPRLRSQALHFPRLGVSLGSLTGIPFSVNLLETISAIKSMSN